MGGGRIAGQGPRPAHQVVLGLVAVVPERPGRAGAEGVDDLVAGEDGALRGASDAVRAERHSLVDAVPVHLQEGVGRRRQDDTEPLWGGLQALRRTAIDE